MAPRSWPLVVIGLWSASAESRTTVGRCTDLGRSDGSTERTDTGGRGRGGSAGPGGRTALPVRHAVPTRYGFLYLRVRLKYNNLNI